MAVYASPNIRHERVINRAAKHGNDENLKYRSFTLAEVKSRDHAEIEKLNKGGPIAMADFTVINEGSKKDLKKNLTIIWRKINAKER